MKLAMLWFDPDPKWPLSRKLEAAANRYAEKFGHAPTIANVPVGSGVDMAAGMQVVEDGKMRDGYLMVGREA